VKASSIGDRQQGLHWFCDSAPSPGRAIADEPGEDSVALTLISFLLGIEDGDAEA
jgi:hypothetical protein